MTEPPALIIGNSYLGAVLTAARHDPAGALFDFAAAGGHNYAAIAVEDGRLINARAYARTGLRSGKVTDGRGLRAIGDYGAVFLYGYLPGPIDLALTARRLRKHLYSAQVIARSLEELVAASPSLTLRARLRAATDAPIFVLPGNPPSTAGAIPAAECADMRALVERVVGEGYLPAPDVLTLADGTPDPAFYKDSVGLRPFDPARDVRVKHDIQHFNAEGGAVWLARMAEVTRALALEVRPARARRR